MPRPPREHRQRARRQRAEIAHIRHHSLYAPRDFDISPYFSIVKPTLAFGFDYRSIHWAQGEGETEPPQLAAR